MASPGPTAVIRSPVISTTGFSTMRPDCTSSIALAFTARWIGGGAAALTSVANTVARRKRIDVLAIANVWGGNRELRNSGALQVQDFTVDPCSVLVALLAI